MFRILYLRIRLCDRTRIIPRSRLNWHLFADGAILLHLRSPLCDLAHVTVQSGGTGIRQIIVGGARSDFIETTSGVPQGSILGPLLYNAYLSDVASCFKHCRFLMFADDKKIYLAIKSIDDCNRIQSDLNKLSEYYRKNKITVNISKCVQITFTRKIKKINYTYMINNVPLKEVCNVKDLGITLDSKLLMADHIENTINKAYKQLGYIKRVSRQFTNIECIKTLYFSYVRSILEYSCSIWSPMYKKYIISLEAIQQQLLKFLCYKDYRHFDTYTERCRYYNIELLETRRRQYDMMFLHGIWNGGVDCSELLASLLLRVPKRRSRHTDLFNAPLVNTNYAKNSVLCRMVYTYNKFYADIDIFHLTKRSFKLAIKAESK